MHRSANPLPPTLRVIFSGRMLVAFAMGFACGLPLLLTLSVLQAWMTDEGVDLGTIGLFAAGPAALHAEVPVGAAARPLSPAAFLGRRRGWMLAVQLALCWRSIVTLGLHRPGGTDPWLVAACALRSPSSRRARTSSSTPTGARRWRTRSWGLGASLYVNGYRVGMLLAGGGGLILADLVPFDGLSGDRPDHADRRRHHPAGPGAAGGSRGAAHPARPRWSSPSWSTSDATTRSGSSRSSCSTRSARPWPCAMTTPFYLDLGFTKTEIGAVVKLFGFWATIIGGLLGGVFHPAHRHLSGALVVRDTAGGRDHRFRRTGLDRTGASVAALAAVIAGENLSGGMGTCGLRGVHGLPSPTSALPPPSTPCCPA